MRGLYLDLNKALAWATIPGAAAMLRNRDEQLANARATREVMQLYTAEGMPKPRLMTSDGNFTSPLDVVKGLGFSAVDESLWAHRVARMVGRAPDEVTLRKAVAELRHADDEKLSNDPALRSELGRRIVSLYRQQRGGKPLEKAFPQQQPPSSGRQPMKRPMRGPPPAAGASPQQVPGPGRPANMGRPAKFAEHGQPGKPPVEDPPQDNSAAGVAGRAGGVGVDAGPISEESGDPAILKEKLNRLAEMLHTTHEGIHGSDPHVHMHNAIKAMLRQVFQDPTPDAVREAEHQVKHFVALVQGSADPLPEMDPQGGPPGQPGKGGPAGNPSRAGAPKGATPAPVRKAELLVLDLRKAEGGGVAAVAGAQRANHKYISRTMIGGKWVYKYAPGQGPPAPKVDDKGRPAVRHWVDGHPDHPTFESGGTAKKYGIDPKTGISSDPERAALHKRIIDAHTAHVQPAPKGTKPVAIVTMGGPASGKTTALKQLGYAGRNDFVSVDPDAVKTGEGQSHDGLPEFHEGAEMGHLEDGTPVSSRTAAAVTHDESSYIADRIRDHAVEHGKNVIIDGTGKNADKHAKLIQSLKEKGYHVHLVMPHQTAENANKLNAGRAAGTGRYVPDSIVNEAYSKIPHNFEKVAAHADKATLFDASNGFPPKLAYERDGDGEKIHDKDFMDHFRSSFGGDVKKSDEPAKSKKKAKKGDKPLAIPQEQLDKMIADAMHAGVRDEYKHLDRAGGHKVGNGIEMPHDDKHIDIGIKRGSI